MDSIKSLKRKELEDSDVINKIKKSKLSNDQLIRSSPRLTSVESNHIPSLSLEQKDSSKENKVVSAEEYRKKHEIIATGTPGLKILDPFQSFEATGFSDRILKAFTAAGFSAPSAIQAQAWPMAMTDCDVLGIAKTGSGKTIAFLLPIFTKILVSLKSKPLKPKHPLFLVLAPTRELALQIHTEAVKFGRILGIRAAAVYGGASKGPQIHELRNGVHGVIGTPGRVNDLMSMTGYDTQPIMSLDQVGFLVLDEADRMLDMGFEPIIREITSKLPPHQVLFFTATWPKAVQGIARDLLSKNVCTIKLSTSDELVANKDVLQQFKFCADVDKKEILDAILKERNVLSQDPNAPKMKTIIFCNQKARVQGLADALWEEGAKVDALHGDKAQNEREKILNGFRNGNLDICVATDVAARGLDIKGVDMVINYDFPNSVEDYVHRIGRTGRAGVKGVSITLFNPRTDRGNAKELVGILREAQADIPQELMDLIPKGFQRNGGGGNFGRGGRGGSRGRGGFGGGGGYGNRW